MPFARGDTAIIAATGTAVEIITVSTQGFALVHGPFGQWTYRVEDLRREGQPLDAAVASLP